MALGVVGVGLEHQIGRVAVVELGMAEVIVIDEKEREVTMRSVRHGALAVVEVSDLHPSFLAEMDVSIVEEEDQDFVAGVVVDIHLLAVVLREARARQHETTDRNECRNEQGLTGPDRLSFCWLWARS